VNFQLIDTTAMNLRHGQQILIQESKDEPIVLLTLHYPTLYSDGDGRLRVMIQNDDGWFGQTVSPDQVFQKVVHSNE
jgi:hypothetical protein